MKRSIKTALSAVVALTAAASAQAYVNGDLLAGFTGTGVDYTDFIFDLGQATSLYDGETWTLNTGLSATGLQFGVIGAQSSGKHIYATSGDTADSYSINPAGLFQQSRADITTIAQSLTAGNYRTTDSSDTTGWTYETAQAPGTPGNVFFNHYGFPNVAAGTTAYFYDGANSGNVASIGAFAFDAASGVLTYSTSVVPEPGVGALLGVLGAVTVAARRKASAKA